MPITENVLSIAPAMTTQKLTISNIFDGHRVQGLVVIPGSAYLALALTAMNSTRADEAIEFTNIDFKNAFIKSEGDTVDAEIVLKPTADDGWYCKCQAITNNGTDGLPLIYADMQVAFGVGVPQQEMPTFATLEAARSTAVATRSSTELYADFREAGNDYRDRFQLIDRLWQQTDISVAKLAKQSNVDEQPQFALDPFFLDGCVQLFATTADLDSRTFVLEQIGNLNVHSKPTAECWAIARLESSNDDTGTYFGSVDLFTADGMAIWSLSDIKIRLLDKTVGANTHEAPTNTIAVAATFTADPLEDALQFWSDKLESRSTVKFAPYNQVFQELLTPTSLLNSNDGGMNVVLIRPEDWVSENSKLSLQVGAQDKERILAAHHRHELKTGIEIAHLNQYETEYVYQEIFNDLAYLKNGITINDGDCIIDIGANIGLFMLFVQQQASNATVYSFEPSPPVFDILSANAQLYGENAHVFNLGVSDRKKDAEFTFYEKSSVFSSFSADKEADEHAIRAVIENMVKDNEAVGADQVEQLVNDLIADRLTSTNYTCQLTSLSDIIRENQIEQIDLLKLDAEKSELPVLQGINDEDWEKIKQIVIEVHDQEGPLIEEVTRILRSRGFEFEIEEEEFLHNSGLYNIFATRPALSSALESQTDGLGTANDDFAAVVDKNITDLLAAFDASASLRNMPTILVTCPPSPAVAANPVHATALASIEQEIKNEVDNLNNVSYLSSQEITEMYPVTAYYDADGERLGHVPYTETYFAALGTAISRRAQALTRKPYKVIVLDCDNTLWHGVCGEDGVDGVDISAPFVALQQFMHAQLSAGMLLCLCSKNIEDDVWAVFDGRADMLLQQNDIVAHRINWQAKSQNIFELAQELQLGLDSFIFVDDNPVECAEVRAALPQVLTLQLPSDTDAIPDFLHNVWAFDHLKATEEDQKRTTMYRENIERERFRTSGVTLEGFLDSLNLDIQIDELKPENLERVSQLTYRTNQFNMTTVRRSTAEIQRACDSGQLRCLITKVTDRFGDYGLVGVVLYEIIDNVLVVDTFLLSCRVLGRGVEHSMVAALGEAANANSLLKVCLPYISTKKNQPALDFLESISAAKTTETGSDKIIYTLSSTDAAQIRYRPSDNQAYAETAMARSTATKPSTNGSSPDTYFDSGQREGAIATELATAEVILTKVRAQATINRQTSRAADYVAPTTDLQSAVAEIWQQLLGIERVGIKENFFEIGGSSLKGVQLIARLKQSLGTDLGIVDLFAAPTIGEMTELIQHKQSGKTVISKSATQSENRGAKRRERMRLRRR